MSSRGKVPSRVYGNLKITREAIEETIVLISRESFEHLILKGSMESGPLEKIISLVGRWGRITYYELHLRRDCPISGLNTLDQLPREVGSFYIAKGKEESGFFEKEENHVPNRVIVRDEVEETKLDIVRSGFGHSRSHLRNQELLESILHKPYQ
ncbi:hypothetical protein Tco_1385570 [Tanacetum coccineum]